MRFIRAMHHWLRMWKSLWIMLCTGALSGFFLWMSFETGHKLRIAESETAKLERMQPATGQRTAVDRLLKTGDLMFDKKRYGELFHSPTPVLQFIKAKEYLTAAPNNTQLWHDLDIFNQTRFTLDPSFKSPCWWASSIPEVTCTMEKSSTESAVNWIKTHSKMKHEKRYLRCLPYFYIIGQAKCATSNLFSMITKHPEVAPMLMKETQWVCRARLTDGTPGYFSNNDFWDMLPGNERCTEPCVTNANIVHHLVPNAKLILILRNPTTRLYSLYFHKARALKTKTSQENFHSLVVREVGKFQQCLKQQTLRGCCYNYTLSDSLTGEIDIRRGIYHIFLTDWMKVFPGQQFHIIKFEDYISNQMKTLKQIYKFLDLSELPDEAPKKTDNTKKGKPHSHRVDMWNTTRDILNTFYKPYNEQFVKLLNDDRFRW